MSAIAVVADLGKLFHQRRKQLGMTQIELSKRLNCGHRFIRELEQGKPTLQIDKVLKACQMLDIHIFVEPIEEKAALSRDEKPLSIRQENPFFS